VGKYRIIRALGQGGEGSVYLAEDESLGRQVAVKRLWGREEPEEASFLRDLRHPMLPVVYELLHEDGWYLVMEYIDARVIIGPS
jgi:serine/threonine protein kinase